MAELKHLAVNCNFGDHLEDAFQRTLLSESELTYASAVELATGKEATEINTQQLKSLGLKQLLTATCGVHAWILKSRLM